MFDNHIKHIICLGDLFHTNQTIHAEVLSIATFVMEHYRRNNIQFHCLVGNHDMASRDGLIHSLPWLREYGNVIDRPSRFEIEGRRISALPYTENIDALIRFLEIPEELVLLHQGVNLNDRGSAWVINEIFKKEMVPEHVKRVLTGHYHKPCDDGKISIVGSPMQHNWSDYDDAARGCLILDLDTLEITRVENIFSSKFLKVDYENIHADINNKFVKMLGCPKDKVDNTREIVLKHGAISVEFDMPVSTITKNDTKPVFSTLESVLSDYDNTVDGRKLEVGHQVREQRYEAPKL